MRSWLSLASPFVVLIFLQLTLTEQKPSEGSAVLVLGSGGLIGRNLVNWLERHNYQVVHVRNREHIDLRVHGALDVYNNSKITFCFFLACEVGGSKFIENADENIQLNIIQSNIYMYQMVLPWLKAHRIPFLFTSSYLQGTQNAYGSVKRLGEQWIHQMDGLGKMHRLWNVYGVEDVGLKSHVMSDWVHGCVGFGSVRSRSDGSELRQFIHVHDVAAALGSSMEHFDDLDMVTDISTGEWVAMRAVGATMEDAVAAVLNLPCTVHYDHANPAKPRGHISPDMTTRLYKYWKPQIQLRQGIEMLVREEAEKFARAKAAKGKTEL